MKQLINNNKRMGEGGLRLKGNYKKSSLDKPLVSIITVVFNGEKYIEETILSVLMQDYDNVEYIIIDGGSTDNTREIIKRYENYVDYWVSEPDSGMYEAINKGLELMNGDYFASLNSDDVYYDENIISTMAEKFQANSSLFWLYGDFVVIDSGGAEKYRYKIPPYNWRALLFANYCYIPQPTSFMKSQVVEQVGKFNQQYKLASDYEYFLRVGERYPAEKIERPVVKFRYHQARLSEVRAQEAREENIRIQMHYQIYGNIYYRAIYFTLINLFFKIINVDTYIRRIFQ